MEVCLFIRSIDRVWFKSPAGHLELGVRRPLSRCFFPSGGGAGGGVGISGWRWRIGWRGGLGGNKEAGAAKGMTQWMR